MSDLYFRNLEFLNRSRYCFFQVSHDGETLLKSPAFHSNSNIDTFTGYNELSDSFPCNSCVVWNI
jgi:hypothetical protein